MENGWIKRDYCTFDMHSCGLFFLLLSMNETKTSFYSEKSPTKSKFRIWVCQTFSEIQCCCSYMKQNLLLRNITEVFFVRPDFCCQLDYLYSILEVYCSDYSFYWAVLQLFVFDCGFRIKNPCLHVMRSKFGSSGTPLLVQLFCRIESNWLGRVKK